MTSLISAQSLKATAYYVATNGLDTAAGTSIATAWRTINHAAQTVVAGDMVNIRGGTYRETVTVAHSGTSSAPITFQAYTNEIPIISGATNLDTGWVLESPNIYYTPATLPLLSDNNQVFQGGLMKPEARWPNAGSTYPWQNSFTNPSPDWAYVTTAAYNANSNGRFTCASLPSRADGYWNGAVLHIMSGYGWLIATPNVTGYTNASRTVVTDDANGANAAYAFQTGNEFYISGKKGELDSAGEWYYDSVNSRLYFYSSTTPASVEAKIRIIGLDVSGRAYINLKNLSFFGCTIQTDGNSTNHVYDSLTMKYIAHSQKPSAANRVQLRSGDVLRNSDFGFASGSMIFLGGNDIRVINNQLHDAGYTPDGNGLICSSAVYQRSLISHNSIHDGGRGLVGVPARAMIIEYNDIYRGMKLTTDGGAAYDFDDATPALFHHNLVHDVQGAVGHTSSFGVVGLYLDALTSNWVVHHNVIWNISGFAVNVNARFDFDFILNNTFASSGGSLHSDVTQDGEAGTAIYNNLFDGLPQGQGGGANWLTSDMRYNLYTDPGFATNSYTIKSNSIAIDQGTAIPGVTDGYLGAAPDLGAFELGDVDWTAQVGWNSTPPAPDPIYNYPNLIFANKIIDGSFESGNLSPNWVASGAVSLIAQPAWVSGLEGNTRSGAYGLSIGSGTSQVGQIITNLLPGNRYKFYAGVFSSNTSATITLGVTNYGQPVREVTVTATNIWSMNNLAFVTGSNNTSANVYVKVSSTDARPVYVDDIGVILKNEPPDNPSKIPMAHYTLDDTNTLTAVDSSGNGRNAVLTSGPATDWTNAVLNGGLYFNGADRLLTPAITTPSTGLTVACWARSSSTTWNAHGCLISQRPSFVLGPYMGSLQMRWIINTDPSTQVYLGWTAPGSFDITKWHHYAGVYNPTNQLASLYVDGVSMATISASTINIDTGQIYIGKDDYSADNNRNFIGSIDDVWICNYAMSASEILALASTNSDLLLHLALDDGAGSATAYDSTAHGGNGTLTNMNSATAWTNGILNGATSFNGSNSCVFTTPIQTPASLTVSCWARSATPLWNADGCLVSHRPAFVLNPIMGTRNFEFDIYTNAANYVFASWIAPANFDITQWHYYAGVFNPSNQLMSLYVDGTPVATNNAAAVNLDKGKVFIGQDSSGGANRNFKGLIDDVRIYPRALQSYELLDLAHLTSEPPYFFVTPASPVYLSATATGSNAIELSWAAADVIQNGYRLDYRPTGTAGWTNLVNLGGNITNYLSAGLASGTAYDYRIIATNAFGASGFVIATTITYTGIQAWRQQFFGNTANIGNGADGADPDHDGLPNLLEYALGRNPLVPDTSPTLKVTINADGQATITFMRARADMTYILKCSTDLTTWTTIATNPGTIGSNVEVLDAAAPSTSSRFFRLAVTLQ